MILFVYAMSVGAILCARNVALFVLIAALWFIYIYIYCAIFYIIFLLHICQYFI